MILVPILFYVFATVMVFSALAVISVRNSVHAVLFLILCFFNASGLFILLGAEFLAMILVIVYVGAVAVLFLFVVMMMDVDFSALKQGFLRYLPLGFLVAAILFVELYFIIDLSLSKTNKTLLHSAPESSDIENTKAIGAVLYTDFAYIFELSGLVLLVAMIGAIVLTHRHREGVRRQNITRQIYREARETVKMVKVESGKGVKL